MVALWRSTRTRKASRSPASVRSIAMASAARTLSTLSFIRILRQVFGLAVRFARHDSRPVFRSLAASYVVAPVEGQSLHKSHGGLKYRIITVDLRAEPASANPLRKLSAQTEIEEQS